jgi:nuclease S1
MHHRVICLTLLTVDAAYLDTNKPVVKEQLQKAGVRLAHLLDTAFGN